MRLLATRVQGHGPHALRVPSSASVAVELKKRAQMLIYGDHEDEDATLKLPFAQTASNELLEAAADAVDAIHSELGMAERRIGKHSEPDTKLTRNKLLGTLFSNLTAGGCIISDERAEALGKCVSKHLGKVRDRASSIDKAAVKRARKLLKAAEPNEQELVMCELERLLQLTELRAEVYSPRTAAPTVPDVGEKRRLELLPPSERPAPERVPLPPPCSRSGSTRGGEELPWEFQPASSGTIKEQIAWDAGWAACNRVRDLEDRVSELQKQVRMLESEVKELRPLEVENAKMWNAVSGLRFCLSKAVDAWDGMCDCAAKHGWDGELGFEDSEGHACCWSLYGDAEFEELEAISKESVEQLSQRFTSN